MKGCTYICGHITEYRMHRSSNTSLPPIKVYGIWTPGVMLMRNMVFRVKALFISMVFLVPTLGLIAWMMQNQTDQALQDRMNSTRQHVEVAHGVVVWAHARQVSGELTQAAAQAMAQQAVSQLRYEHSEYFWINDMTPVVVMHPIKPELNGKNVGGIKDPNGFAMFHGFLDTVQKNGQGFVSYLWPKPGMDLPVGKMAYVKGFAPWGG